MLVVGASSGIGAAFAKAVAAAGGQVSVSARRSDRLEQLVAEMGTGYAVPGDATNPDDARMLPPPRPKPWVDSTSCSTLPATESFSPWLRPILRPGSTSSG
ncbi:MAG: hypothetical protein Ct9H300mP12_13350 [Acidimicrobiales bacterium]|nr:MAG: hypothetical protein Ct9H300mP12_13350 [Acidimicrobiales bacterium]